MEQPSYQPDGQPLNRSAIYIDPNSLSPFEKFKWHSRNGNFRISILTWVTLAVLMLAYPMMNMIPLDEDPAEMLRNLDDFLRMVVLITTIITLWALFGLAAMATWRENTGLPGVGFHGLKNVEGTFSTHAMLALVWGFAFLVFSWLFLSGVAWLLAQVGLPMPGELKFLIPQDAVGRIVWVGVSITAGVCEETLFRGYLMTRLRLVFGLQSWVVPAILSSLIFGICHSYQGLPGMIVLSIYGGLFAILYIRTGSIWPGIIAHTFQDLLALFIPQ